MAANKNKPAPSLTTSDPDQGLKNEMEETLAIAEKAQAEAIVVNTPAPTAVLDDPSKDMVKVHLFKDNHRYKDDVFVGLNGRYYQIKRGVDVEVPRAVAEILEQSMAQDIATAELTEKLQADYAAKAKEAGL